MAGWLTGLGAALALSLLLLFTNHQLDRAREQNAKLRVELSIAREANQITQQTLNVCKEINRSNADARDTALRKAVQAEGRISALEQTLAELSFKHDIETDENCRTLADPLPDSFLDSLCIDTANCDADRAPRN